MKLEIIYPLERSLKELDCDQKNFTILSYKQTEDVKSSIYNSFGLTVNAVMWHSQSKEAKVKNVDDSEYLDYLDEFFVLDKKVYLLDTDKPDFIISCQFNFAKQIILNAHFFEYCIFDESYQYMVVENDHFELFVWKS